MLKDKQQTDGPTAGKHNAYRRLLFITSIVVLLFWFTVCAARMHTRDKRSTVLRSTNLQDVPLHGTWLAGVGLGVNRRRTAVYGSTTRFSRRSTAACWWGDGPAFVPGWGWRAEWRHYNGVKWRHCNDVRETAGRERPKKIVSPRWNKSSLTGLYLPPLRRSCFTRRSFSLSVCLLATSRKISG